MVLEEDVVTQTDRMLTIDEIEDALQLIADWLVACYGPRLEAISLTLEGYYTSDPEYYGILPWITRGEGETRDTLPSRQVRDLAEGIFARLLPQARIDRNTSRDVRDVARSGRVDASCVSAHRRVELLTRFGRPDELGGRETLERGDPGAGSGG